jgi:hypothetical protein
LLAFKFNLYRYNPDHAIRRLEASVMHWLHAMGLLPDGALGATFEALCPDIAKGVLLCDLVVAVEVGAVQVKIS